MAHDDDFYEDDEPIEDVVAAFEAGVPVDFAPPPTTTLNTSSSEGWTRLTVPPPTAARPIVRPALRRPFPYC
ncbi:MAG: hypothetical protein WKF86_09210, partial [Acidimicrobiales bacterium]